MGSTVEEQISYRYLRYVEDHVFVLNSYISNLEAIVYEYLNLEN
jgi:hypothetical protein